MAVTETTVLEAVLRRDRFVVIAALIAVIAAAWIWTALGAGTGTNAIAMTHLARIPDMDTMMERVAWTPHAVGAGTLVPGRTSCFPYGHERPLSAQSRHPDGSRRTTLSTHCSHSLVLTRRRPMPLERPSRSVRELA